MHQMAHPSTGEVLARLAHALDGLDHDQRRLADPAERLALVEDAHRLAERLQALTQTLVAEAQTVDAAMTAAGCSLKSWLTDRLLLSNRRAGTLIHASLTLAQHEGVREAAVSGRVGRRGW